MADIAPFAGLRYNLPQVGGLQQVVAPPYDVITPDEQAALYERHPANVVRLILGKELPGDDGQNRYTRAAACLEEWLRDGVLLREKDPALYLCRMEYEDAEGAFRALTILYCQLRLEALGAGGVLPHEATLSGPKEDRLRLLRATRTNLSGVFCLVSDPNAVLEQLCAERTARPPLGSATDIWGVRHRLWVETDPSIAAAARAFLQEKPLFIADGHHRYETALRYRDEVRAANGNRPGPWDWTLVAIAALESPGITVLPTHRVVREVAPAQLNTFLERARDLFAVEPAGDLSELLACMRDEQAAGRHAFGVFHADEGFHLLRLTAPERADALLDPVRAPAWRQLDVALLHGIIIEHLLGVSSEQAMQSGQIGYLKDAAQCVRQVEAGEFQAALFLNPTPPEAVKEVALAGEKMPQKSTYFFPKLLSGLVMRPVY